MPDSSGSLVSDAPISRREALRRTTIGAIALSTGACLGSTEPSKANGKDGRLSTRVSSPSRTAEPGLHELGFGVVRDGFYYVPASYRATTPAPVALLLHGAGRNATEMLDPFARSPTR